MKTKIGLSACAYASLTFVLALYGGFIPLIIAVGYVLLFETNEWLRTTVVKALVLLAAFTVLRTLVGAIPTVLDFVNSLVRVFGNGFSTGKFGQFFTFLYNALDILKTVVFLVLAFFALKMKTINIGFVDKFVEKHLSLER